MSAALTAVARRRLFDSLNVLPAVDTVRMALITAPSTPATERGLWLTSGPVMSADPLFGPCPPGAAAESTPLFDQTRITLAARIGGSNLADLTDELRTNTRGVYRLLLEQHGSTR